MNSISVFVGEADSFLGLKEKADRAASKVSIDTSDTSDIGGAY